MSSTGEHWLAVFQNALSHVPIHNYLVRAYHDAGMSHLVPPDKLWWHIPASAVPAKVRKLVRADLVISDAKQRIDRARQAIEKLRPHLDRERTITISHSPDRPYARLHASIVVAHRVQPGYAPIWSYRFNPYILAVALLDEYERFIDKEAGSRRAPFTKLSRICQKAKELKNNADLISIAAWRIEPD